MRRTSFALVAVVVSGIVAVAPAAGAPEQTPKRGGTVVIGLDGDSCVNPLACGLRILTHKVLLPAFATAPDLTLQPRLVSSVTVTKRPPFTLTYRIRPEARWSDRVPVTARDFEFTHEAIQKARAANADLASYAVHDSVKAVRLLGAKIFRVVLRSRDARWQGLFEVVLPRHALAGQDLTSAWRDGIVNPKTGRPIGSGPFLLQRWERGKQYTLVRNPNYWGPHVSYLDRLVVRFQERVGGTPLPLEVLEGLRRGELDFAFTQDPSFVPELRRLPGVRVFHVTTDRWEHIDIRIGQGGHPALRDKRVRRALAYGVDRVNVVRRLYGDLDPAYRPSDSAIFLGSHAAYRPNWSKFRYRPAESRRLLEQAGCRRETDGIYSCAGRRLELRLVTLAGASHRIRSVELVQAQLRRAGMEIETQFAPGAVLFPKILPSGDFDLVFLAYIRGFAASETKRSFGCGAPGNLTGYCQRLVTRDLDQADRILDAEQRARVLNRADRQLAKDVPVIPFYDSPFVLALRNTVRNVVVSPEDLLWNAEDWWLER